MNKLILAGAAALAFAVPASAQDMAVTSDGDAYVLTAPQQSTYDGWPTERQTVYSSWPSDYQTYYWTLTEPQQNGWWVLTDDQRAKVYAMTPQQRTAAWVAIEKQMSGMPASASATATATGSTTVSSGNMRFVSNEMVQDTPGDAGPPSGDVPICSANQQDNCINAWEAGKRGKGVARPLDYWPGKPASEIPGDKPLTKPTS